MRPVLLMTIVPGLEVLIVTPTPAVNTRSLDKEESAAKLTNFPELRSLEDAVIVTAPEEPVDIVTLLPAMR